MAESSSPPSPRVRPTIAGMDGYTPGEQPAPGERVVKLNTNENPYPPSPRVMEAIRAVDADRLRRYPNPTADAFRATAAEALGVTPDMILAGNGSDDILAIVVRTFLGPGDALAAPEPTYSLYPVLARIGEVKFIPVPWGPSWSLPTEALLATGARAVFFANPNAPSGTLVPRAAVRDLCHRFAGVVLCDEAYVQFADPQPGTGARADAGDAAAAGADCVPLLADCPNLVLSRTLSKAYSLAGLRFGWAMASAPLIAQMQKAKDSYNCDAISVAAAVAALADPDHARKSWNAVRAERTRLTTELSRRGFSVIPSQANFLLAGVPGRDGGAVYRALKARGILVRFFDRDGLRDKIRITVGTPAENDTLLAALDR